jgi:hypothetical protein|eukprot:COSAG06_NODE_423_length_15942_cov_7.276463_5_plen_791_part_00
MMMRLLAAAAVVARLHTAGAWPMDTGVDWEAEQRQRASGVDPAGDLQRKIDAAIASGSPQLEIPAGDYLFGNRTLLIAKASDFALVAAGDGPVELVFANSEGGVIIHSCTNVTISGRNATGRAGIHVDRSPPPFAQGTVTKKSEGGKGVEFTLDGDSADPRTLSGSLDPTDHWPNGSSGVMTHGWKKGSRGTSDTRGNPISVGSLSTSKVVEIAPRTFRASLGDLGAADVGDQFVSSIWKGFMYNVANSSSVTTEDLAIHATGYMGVYEADGGGGHVYRRFSLVPRNGRIISSNADGIHSEDLDVGPTIVDSHFHSMLDDFMGVHATLLLVQSVETSSGGTTKLRIVHPHVSDLNTFGSTELWYGTSEPMRRVFAGDALDLFDPLTFAPVGTVTAKSPAVLLSPATAKPWESPISKAADALFPDCCTHFPDFEPEHYKMQHFANSVYEVEVTGLPPAPAGSNGTLLKYVLEIAKTQNAGSVVSNCTFHSSTGFYARWKSSDSILEGNEWLDDVQGVFELQMLPSYFEGPSHIRNVTIRNNVFQTNDAKATIAPGLPPSIMDTKAGGAKCCDIEGLVLSGNRLLKPTAPPPAPPPAPAPPPTPPSPPIKGYSQFNVDISLSNDDAYGGLCTNEALVGTSSVWDTPTALCDLLDCPRFGTFGGNGRPAPGPPPKDTGYCIKGWGGSSGTHSHSYLSQSRCGGGVVAKTVNGSCNRPGARYTMCPNGAGTTLPIEVLPGHKTAEQAAVACDHDARCVGFTLKGGTASLLSYGLKGIGPYTGYASYTRIPAGDL